MIDINYILNGKRKRPKKSKDPLRDLMIKPKNTIIGDRVTKQQKKVFKKAKKQKSFMPMFSDWDGDEVINGLDCQPRNKKKHAYWKPMDPQKQREMRDNIIEKHYQEKGYYKYGGPDRLQAEDLDNVKNRFTSNPLRKYITINQDRITPEQRFVLQSGQDRFSDTDKDGVIDGLDCKPKDPKKHNDDEDLMNIAKQTYYRPEEVEADWQTGSKEHKQKREQYYDSIKKSKIELTDEEKERLKTELSNVQRPTPNKQKISMSQYYSPKEYEDRQKIANERFGKDWIDLNDSEKRSIRKERIDPWGNYVNFKGKKITTYRGMDIQDD